jgi:hypothetical protein
MAITNFMNLNLPVVTQTLGPNWASQLNAALEVVDSHDHSSGKGVRVKTAGLDINSDLTFNSFRAIGLRAGQFSSQAVPLSGALNSNSVYVSGGNLYFTNSSGIAIQLTDGGSIVSSPGAVQTLNLTSIASNLTIAPSDTFVYILVDTTASRTVTLPLASAVPSGRLYIIKDQSQLSNNNPITLAASGADTIDGNANFTIDSNGATIWLIGDGAASWTIL